MANSILPAHCLNIFIPLVDVESNNGGTEFCLGSHFNTKFFTEDIVWQDSHWKDRIGFKGDVLAIKVNAGEVLAFDYRVLHRYNEQWSQFQTGDRTLLKVLQNCPAVNLDLKS